MNVLLPIFPAQSVLIYPGGLFLKMIKILNIRLTYYRWDIWCFFTSNIFPINPLKERMGFNFLCSIYPKSLFLIRYQFFN